MRFGRKIISVGRSAAISLKELRAYLDRTVGQTIWVNKTSRGIKLRAPSADLDTQMAVAREVMARRKLALRQLAQ